MTTKQQFVDEKKTKSGRTFTASLKPAWTREKIEDFLESTRSTATCWAITHDSDIDEQGEVLEAHTHVLIDYATPRKVGTVANLLGVADNFVEVVRNKQGALRYLTHKDQRDKHQYLDDEVGTNSDVAYSDTCKGAGLSDRDIARYLSDGRGMELLGLVPSGKIRTIQAILHFDQGSTTLNELRAIRGQNDQLREQNEQMLGFFSKVEKVVTELTSGIVPSFEMMVAGINAIAQGVNQYNQIQLQAPKRK